MKEINNVVICIKLEGRDKITFCYVHSREKKEKVKIDPLDW